MSKNNNIMFDMGIGKVLGTRRQLFNYSRGDRLSFT